MAKSSSKKIKVKILDDSVTADDQTIISEIPDEKTTSPSKTQKTTELKPPSLPPLKKAKSNKYSLFNSPIFSKIYLLTSLVILTATTLYWSILSSKIELSNSDQLVNAYLFDNLQTMHGAYYTGAHTFLIKWPIFLLIKLFGASDKVFIGFTVAIVLLTVGALVYILRRIERRPLVLGTLCLALASVLLLIPTQPYPGGLLPVNMAMITTRNLEYIVYIISLIQIIKSPHVRSRKFWISIALLALLIASDKLFLTLSVGGAALALVLYALLKRWTLVNITVRWLIASIVGSVIALIILSVINSSGLTHILSQSSAGPFGLAQTPKGVLLGAIYSGLALMTNFGANPAANTPILKDIPHQLVLHFHSLSIFAFIINGLLLFAALYMVLKIVSSTIRNKGNLNKFDWPTVLSITLIFTTIVVFGAFIVSQHYFAGDARYLSIVIFSLFIVAANYARKQNWRNSNLVLVGTVITLGIVVALPNVASSYKEDSASIIKFKIRDNSISQALAHHPTNVLVGDYWRVIPTKLAAKGKLNVMPLVGCTEAQVILSSKAWQPDLRRNSFAYLLSLDGNLTNYPDDCTLQQVINGYGRPNASALIAGSLKQPKELLLFYDHGVNKSSPAVNPPTGPPATVLPISLDQTPYTTCSSPTIMNIVAHQDDDLLFTSPSLLRDIRAGHCIRTVYLTAGDAGSDQFYWLNREKGAEAAYSNMIGSKAVWIQRIVKLNDHEYITISNPRANTNISLIFLHLPDGNVRGQGFNASHNQSLEQLLNAKIKEMDSVDGQSYYSSNDLTAAITTLMVTYHPTTIRTQAPRNLSAQYPDHSDHIATGQFVKMAYSHFEKQQFDNQVIIPIEYYIGYPIHGMSVNVFGSDLRDKDNAFFAYGQFDPGVCQSVEKCNQGTAYSEYLKREYQTTSP